MRWLLIESAEIRRSLLLWFRHALEFQLIKIEIGIGDINLHLVHSSLCIECEGDEAFGEWIDDTLASFHAKSIVMPVLKVSDEVGRRAKAQHQELRAG